MYPSPEQIVIFTGIYYYYLTKVCFIKAPLVCINTCGNYLCSTRIVQNGFNCHSTLWLLSHCYTLWALLRIVIFLGAVGLNKTVRNGKYLYSALWLFSHYTLSARLKNVTFLGTVGTSIHQKYILNKMVQNGVFCNSAL